MSRIDFLAVAHMLVIASHPIVGSTIDLGISNTLNVTEIVAVVVAGKASEHLLKSRLLIGLRISAIRVISHAETR